MLCSYRAIFVKCTGTYVILSTIINFSKFWNVTELAVFNEHILVLQLLLCTIVMQNIQIFNRGPDIFLVSMYMVQKLLDKEMYEHLH